MRRRARGFTLLEAVVALAVLVLGLGVGFESLRMAMSRSQKVRAVDERLAVLDRAMTEVAVTGPLTLGRREDDARGELKIITEATLLVPPDGEVPYSLPVAEVRITVRDRFESDAQGLSARKLVFVPEAPL